MITSRQAGEYLLSQGMLAAARAELAAAWGEERRIPSEKLFPTATTLYVEIERDGMNVRVKMGAVWRTDHWEDLWEPAHGE